MFDIEADLKKAYSDGYKCGRLDALAELLKYIGEMGDYEADRKTENSSEKPNNSKDELQTERVSFAEMVIARIIRITQHIQMVAMNGKGSER